MTCYDFYMYEAFAALARQNVDIVIGCSHQRTDTHQALGQLQTARALLVACLSRRETRGPHHRCDYPYEDPTQNLPRRVSSTDLCE